MAASTQGQALSKYVTLISSDGFEFVVLREAACISGAIKRMLDPTSTFHARSLHPARAVKGRLLTLETFRWVFRIYIRKMCIRRDQVRPKTSHFSPRTGSTNSEKILDWPERAGTSAVDDYIKKHTRTDPLPLSRGASSDAE
jgi:hypothetical protein